MYTQCGTIAAKEAARLALLESIGLVDTPPEPEFDAIVDEAVRLSGYDTALISLMDANRCWFKAAAGLLATPGLPREIPRTLSYCQHALGSSGFFYIADGLRDPRVSHLPSVNGPGGFRAYAGLQLILPEGLSVGSLCLLNRSPRAPTNEDHAMLRRLADRALRLIAARRQRPSLPRAARDALLIADDDDGVRMLLSGLFARRGVRTYIASDGGEALRLFQENAARIAVVLTDFTMPGMDGLALVRALGERPNPPACVVMSGHLEESDRSELAAAGVYLLLEKPFALGELDAVIELIGSIANP